MIWLAGDLVPYIIDGPLIDDDEHPDPEDWKRYQSERAAVEKLARDAHLARLSDV